MTTIDAYLLRLFVKVLLVCFLSLGGLYVVVDVFSNQDEVLECARQANLPELLGRFYGVRLVTLFDFICGLLLLIAALFSVGWLQRTNEFTALLAAGVTKARIVAPLVIAAVVLALGSAALREFIVPRFRDELARGWKQRVGEQLLPMRPRYDNATNVFLDGSHVRAAEQQIEAPVIRLPSPMPGVGKQLTAASAQYLPPADGRPGGYLLESALPPELATARSLVLQRRPVVLTPRDVAWLRPGQAFLVSNLVFEQLAADPSWRQWSSVRQLVTALHNPSIDFGADVRVAVHCRLVKPLLDVTLLFVGLPLVLSTRPRGMFVAGGLGVLVVAAFYLVVIVCQGLGAKYLITPALAAWIPVILFTPLAYANGTALWS